MTTPYDEIAYPTAAFPQTHPDRLATHAALFGLPFAPVSTCRVLDIGCGDGVNIIAMAVAYPRASFVGLDLSASAIARGHELVTALGLANIRLVAGDLTVADFGADAFDYVITHGVYSWVPDAVREALMASVRRHLAPAGVAFVSHNALPGARLRQIIREMLFFHLRGVEGVAARMTAGRARLEAMVSEYADDDVFHQAVRASCQAMLDRSPEVLAHDELGDVYHPVYLHEFLEHAARHGMQFLTEAAGNRAGEGFRPPYAVDDEGFDVLAHAQELDFQVLRPFRQNLLVGADLTIDRRPEPGRLFELWASAPARRAEDEADMYEIGSISVRLPDAGLRAAMDQLGAAWPMAVPVRDLIQDDQRAGALLRMYWAGAIELHTGPSPFSVETGERPKSSPLARLAAARGEARLITLRHSVIEIGDDVGLAFVAKLDGEATLDEIAADLAARVGQPAEQFRAHMPAKLEELARLALLV